MRYVERCVSVGQAIDNITWSMRFASWITKAIDTHLEFATLIAFPLQQWLDTRASLLHYTYSVCLKSYGMV